MSSRKEKKAQGLSDEETEEEDDLMYADDEKEQALALLTLVSEDIARYYETNSGHDTLADTLGLPKFTAATALDSILKSATKNKKAKKGKPLQGIPLYFARTFIDKQNELDGKTQFREHAKAILDGEKANGDITNTPFVLSRAQKQIISRCQRSFGVKSPADGTKESQRKYFTRLMNAAIMIATLTNTSLMALLFPVTQEWVQKQHDNLSKNKYAIQKLSSQGDSSIIATIMKAAQEEYEKFDAEQQDDIEKHLNWQGDGYNGDGEVKRLCNHQIYHLAQQQAIDFEKPMTGPKTVCMVLVNYCVQRWVMEPTLKRADIYLKIYRELMMESPQKVGDLNEKIDALINEKHVQDLEETLRDLAKKTEEVQDPYDSSKTVTCIEEGERTNLQETLKEYIPLAYWDHGIVYKVSEDGPDALAVVLKFLASEAADDEDKDKLQGLELLHPYPTTEWRRFDLKHRPLEKPRSRLSVQERRKLNKQRKHEAQQKAKQVEKRKKIEEDIEVHAAKKEKMSTKQKFYSLLKQAGFKKKEGLLDVAELFKHITGASVEKDMPPQYVHPKKDDYTGYNLADMGIDEGELKKYYKCNHDGDLMFYDPGTEWVKKMESLWKVLLWTGDVAAIKDHQNSTEYKDYISFMSPDEKTERIAQVWVAIFALLDNQLAVENINLEEWDIYCSEAKYTFPLPHHLVDAHIDSVCLCLSYYTIGPQFYIDQEDDDFDALEVELEGENTRDEAKEAQDQRRLNLIEAINRGLSFKDTPKALAVAAKLIRVHHFCTGASATWAAAQSMTIPNGGAWLSADNQKKLEELEGASKDWDGADL